jgi:hypothetical protein
VYRYARTILGYHGCKPSFAEALIRGEIPIADWKPSENEWDWLGHGIYFWEEAPIRARDWQGKGGVVGAIIQLGNCLDLTDIEATELLSVQFEALRKLYRLQGRKLPKNQKMRGDLDCLVINELAAAVDETPPKYDTVRSPFLEGQPAFEGSRILRESHIQIVVRSIESIIGVFRPNLPPSSETT